MRNSVGTPAPPSIVDQYAEFSAPSSGLVTIKSGGVPTPWREKILLDPGKPPQWLPQYWWTHVDFANDVYFAYDDSYDTSLLKMLPRWTQVIAVSGMDDIASHLNH